MLHKETITTTSFNLIEIFNNAIESDFKVASLKCEDVENFNADSKCQLTFNIENIDFEPQYTLKITYTNGKSTLVHDGYAMLYPNGIIEIYSDLDKTLVETICVTDNGKVLKRSCFYDF